ncbi:MAG: hypothetical protein ACYS8W_21405 [Planctomycetota bacterium]|jgi:hypothetical protein
MEIDKFTLYDVGARLYTFPLELDKEVYFRLVRELTDNYPNQKFEPDRFCFSASKEQICEVGPDYIQIMESARALGSAAIERFTSILRRISGILNINAIEALDINVSCLLDVSKLGGRSDIIYFSGHEFLQSYLFHQADLSVMGGEGDLEELGFQFAFRRGGDKYAVRVTPFENDKRFLFLDLQLAFQEQEYEVGEIRQRVLEGVKFLENEIVPFLTRIAHIRSNGKE